jgi:hypothetical protein
VSTLEPAEDKAQRARLLRFALLALALSLVPIGLSQLPGLSAFTLLAPSVALEALMVAALWMRARRSLSRGMARALLYWALAAVLAGAGGASLEFGTTLVPPPDLPWLSKKTCKQEAGAWIMLCPLAFMLDLLLFLFHGIAYAAYVFGWLLQHIGAPLFFASALACLALGALALRSMRHEATNQC